MSDAALCYEDLTPGQAFDCGDHLVTREEALDFAAKYDPQPFHLDEAAAAETHFGRLAVSGWLTVNLTMRMLVDHVLSKQESLGGAGVDELRWHRPVHPGDRLRCRFTVEGKRRSRSRPDMGLLFNKAETFNQLGELVMSYRSTAMIRVRDPQAGEG